MQQKQPATKHSVQDRARAGTTKIKRHRSLYYLVKCYTYLLLSGGGGVNRADNTVNSKLIIYKSNEHLKKPRAASTSTLWTRYTGNFGWVMLILMCPLCMVVTFAHVKCVCVCFHEVDGHRGKNFIALDMNVFFRNLGFLNPKLVEK